MARRCAAACSSSVTSSCRSSRGTRSTRNPFFAPDAAIVPELEEAMDALAQAAATRRRAVACHRPTRVPPGLGAPLYDKLDADIAYAMMGINAVKGVEIGSGIRVRRRNTGSEHGDELTPDGFATNNAGGVLGGISTGQDIEVSIAVKPTSSIRLPRRSIDPQRRADDHRDTRPPRSLRRHPRDADRRGDAGPGAHGSRAAAPRPERRRAAVGPAHSRTGG